MLKIRSASWIFAVMRPGVCTRTRHTRFEWYIPSKSPILRKLLDVESGITFRVFLEDLRYESAK